MERLNHKYLSYHINSFRWKIHLQALLILVQIMNDHNYANITKWNEDSIMKNIFIRIVYDMHYL